MSNLTTNDLDALTRKHTAFASFHDMLTAKGGYRPTLRGGGEIEQLALAYDAAQRRRCDERRAYPERTDEARQANARRYLKSATQALRETRDHDARGRIWDRMLRAIERAGFDGETPGDYCIIKATDGNRRRIYRITALGARGAIYGRRLLMDGRVNQASVIGRRIEGGAR